MVKDLMCREVVCTTPDAKVSEAAKIMERENVGSLIILGDRGAPRGMITDRDIVTRCIAHNIDVDDCTVENVMTESLQTVRETDGIFDCIEMMYGARVRRIPVVDQTGKMVGIISVDDLLAVLSKEFSEISSISSQIGPEKSRWAA